MNSDILIYILIEYTQKEKILRQIKKKKNMCVYEFSHIGNNGFTIKYLITAIRIVRNVLIPVPSIFAIYCTVVISAIVKTVIYHTELI